MQRNMNLPAFLWCGGVALAITTLASAAIADEIHEMKPETVQVVMTDGTRLKTDVYRPQGQRRFPAIVMRTPYSATFGNSWASPMIRQFVQSGYVVVVQDCRGTGRSDGEWLPFSNEHRDGEATLKWVMEQSWCNGKLATFGGSYTGFTQWAAALGVGRSLNAMISQVPALDWYEVCYEGGAYRLEMNRVWNAVMARPKVGQEPLVTIKRTEPGTLTFRKGNWDAVLGHLPLRTWGESFGVSIPWDQVTIDHPSYDLYWKPSTTSDRPSDIAAPNLTVTGWYDQFLNQTLSYTPKLRSSAATELARKHQHLIIGPWGHYIEPVGDRDFGENATINVTKRYGEWLAYWLDGEDTGVRDWPYLRIFVMGANIWRDEKEWPLERAQPTPFYFRGGGNANTLKGDGYLSAEPPDVEKADRYTYDPKDPVPTRGGATNFLTGSGPLDQGEIEQREDVLVYTSERLDNPLEVTGPVKVVLHAATDGRDTDWTAKLVDMHPDGTAYNLCEGIIRARYRTSDEEAHLLQPNEVYRYEIDLWATSNEFQAGHRIRVEISSSNFPRFDRNPNTGNKLGADSELRTARQTVYHDEMRPSHIVLPVIPR